MWLIRVSDMKLVEFPYNPPPYAILSHTWGLPQDEVLFDDMVSGLHHAQAKKAFGKVANTCRLAQEGNMEYCWIDTCCIDNRSSAQLQEAINSMFEWYKSSQICYAYLSDVSLYDWPPAATDNSEGERSDGNLEGHDLDFLDHFRRSRWFTRGWTLQELIAPSELKFYDRSWELIGSKDGDLVRIIQSVTGIPEDLLRGRRKHTEASVAQRMYWASSRETSRKEDIAYCLLGLFAVNMPMLYGEGDNAFLRLQHEILNQIDDESIFAWVDTECNTDEAGLLAEHPRYFANSGDIVINAVAWPSSESSFLSDLNLPAMTSRGIRLQKHVVSFGNSLFIIPLRCTFSPSSSMAVAHPIHHRLCDSATANSRWNFEVNFAIGVIVAPLPGRKYANEFKRTSLGEFLSTAVDHSSCGNPYTLHISQGRLPIFQSPYSLPEHALRSRISSAIGYSLESIPFHPLTETPNIEPICITDLKVRKWATLAYSVQYGAGLEPYGEPNLPQDQSTPSEAQDSRIHPLLLRFGHQFVCIIWIGLHRRITDLAKLHKTLRLMGAVTNASDGLETYAKANPDTVILPGYRIEDGPKESLLSIARGDYNRGFMWDVHFRDICAPHFLERDPDIDSESSMKPPKSRIESQRDFRIICQPISKAVWESNPSAVFVVLF